MSKMRRVWIQICPQYIDTPIIINTELLQLVTSMTLILDRWTVGYHKDLADLHMKYDVTKQEINFFQSKLKARNQNDMMVWMFLQ